MDKLMKAISSKPLRKTHRLLNPRCYDYSGSHSLLIDISRHTSCNTSPFSYSRFRHTFHSWKIAELNLVPKMATNIGREASSSTNTESDNIQSRGCDNDDTGLDGGRDGSLSLPNWEVCMMNDAKEVFKCAVNSVLPKEMVTKHLVVDNNGDVMTVQDRKYRLDGNVHVVGFGKAVLGMARALDDLIGKHIVSGMVSVPQGTQDEFRNAGKTDMLLFPGSSIIVKEGAANNMPDKQAHEAALEIANLVRDVGENDLLVVLISGGGSALLPAPAPPITLSDMLAVTSQMSRSGATIGQLNTVRKQLDFLKGGGLASMASPAQVVSLILSDIVGDPIDLIASAPTVMDSSTPQECLAIFSQLNINQTIPKSVSDFLEENSKSKNNESVADSLSQGSMREISEMSHVQNVIIGSNKIACEKAGEECSKLGYSPFVLSTELEGEAKDVGKMFAYLAAFISGYFMDVVDEVSLRKRVDNVRNLLISQHGISGSQLDEIVLHVKNSKMASQGLCILAGGETTVNVTGTGKGGRNQEMATSAGLQFVDVLKEIFLPLANGNSCENKLDHGSRRMIKAETKTPHIVFLSAGTDGQDGPTTAAGGVVGIDFAESAKSANLNPLSYLENNDSFTLLSNWADGLGLVHTGLTGTNVMDIQLLMIKPI